MGLEYFVGCFKFDHHRMAYILYKDGMDLLRELYKELMFEMQTTTISYGGRVRKYQFKSIDGSVLELDVTSEYTDVQHLELMQGLIDAGIIQEISEEIVDISLVTYDGVRILIHCLKDYNPSKVILAVLKRENIAITAMMSGTHMMQCVVNGMESWVINTKDYEETNYVSGVITVNFDNLYDDILFKLYKSRYLVLDDNRDVAVDLF